MKLTDRPWRSWIITTRSRKSFRIGRGTRPRFVFLLVRHKMHHTATDRTLRLRNCSWPPSQPCGRNLMPRPSYPGRNYGFGLLSDTVCSVWRLDFQSMKLTVTQIEATLSVVFTCSSSIRSSSLGVEHFNRDKEILEFCKQKRKRKTLTSCYPIAMRWSFLRQGQYRWAAFLANRWGTVARSRSITAHLKMIRRTVWSFDLLVSARNQKTAGRIEKAEQHHERQGTY